MLVTSYRRTSPLKTAKTPKKRPDPQNYFTGLYRIHINQLKRTDSVPAKILDKLYLGSVGAAYQLKPLKDRGVTHVLTICEILPPKYPDHFTYKVVSIADDPGARLSTHFKECVEWIHENIQQGGTVFVHCFAGISRSATIIIAYLMRYHNMDLREAHAFVRKQRSFICPNHGFMGQLRRYESFLKKKRQEGEL